MGRAPAGVKPVLSIGKGLAYSTVESGLHELNPDISFDAAVRRPSEYSYVLQGGDNMTEIRTGVYYLGKYVCAIDRDQIPEFKLWEEEDGLEPIPMADIEKYEGTRVSFLKIRPDSPIFRECKEKADKGSDNYAFETDGCVYIYEAFRETKVIGRVMMVGWRHTFERLIARGIPGVTRSDIAEKFKVNMDLVPTGGDRAELERLLYEE